MLPVCCLADAPLPVLRRLARGGRIWEAPREHAYQKAAAGAGHAPVSLSVAAAGAALVAAALAAEALSRLFLAAAVGVVVLLFVWLGQLARRRSI